MMSLTAEIVLTGTLSLLTQAAPSVDVEAPAPGAAEVLAISRASGGDDGNDVFAKAEPVVAPNGVRFDFSSPLDASVSDGLCRDVDFIQLKSLVPLCEYTLWHPFGGDFIYRMGWFDLTGVLISARSGSLPIVTDINGEAVVAITAFSDEDFDGNDDATMLPHGVCSGFGVTVDADVSPGEPFQVHVPNSHTFRFQSTLAAGACDSQCHDVDRVEFKNLVPLCEFELQIQGASGSDFRIGWFDKGGNLIFSEPGALVLVADILGQAFISITSAEDSDFDGFDDQTAAPHGLCSDYALTVHPFPANHGFLEEDLNYDGVVDTADLGALIAAFGTDDFVADINHDGAVDTADLGLLIARFGETTGGE